jgi:aerobic-type carbon monoxide dehydrogenase small subunit (CoxS/CutS family)
MPLLWLLRDVLGLTGTKPVTTIEGLSQDGSHPVQRAWVDANVVQCGYCQPGQIMAAAALLEARPRPTDGEKDRRAMFEHVSHDKLVLWGWDPGVGRAPVSVPHAQPVATFRTWMDAGAPCPGS